MPLSIPGLPNEQKKQQRPESQTATGAGERPRSAPKPGAGAPGGPSLAASGPGGLAEGRSRSLSSSRGRRDSAPARPRRPRAPDAACPAVTPTGNGLLALLQPPRSLRPPVLPFYAPFSPLSSPRGRSLASRSFPPGPGAAEHPSLRPPSPYAPAGLGWEFGTEPSTAPRHFPSSTRPSQGTALPPTRYFQAHPCHSQGRSPAIPSLRPLEVLGPLGLCLHPEPPEPNPGTCQVPAEPHPTASSTPQAGVSC